MKTSRAMRLWRSKNREGGGVRGKIHHELVAGNTIARLKFSTVALLINPGCDGQKVFLDVSNLAPEHSHINSGENTEAAFSSPKTLIKNSRIIGTF